MKGDGFVVRRGGIVIICPPCRFNMEMQLQAGYKAVKKVSSEGGSQRSWPCA